MKAQLTAALVVASILLAGKSQAQTDVTAVNDGQIETVFTGTTGLNEIELLWVAGNDQEVISYKVFCGGGDPATDPVKWTLKGSNNGKSWKDLDERTAVKFCSRDQEMLCTVENPGKHKFYMLAAEAADGQKIEIADVQLFNYNLWVGWENFTYPQVAFKSENPDTKGAQLYAGLVQDPGEYVKFHARKVCQILFWIDTDDIPVVNNINYVLRDYDGISSKSGGRDGNISIQYSTRWVEKSAAESTFKLDFETRGVLYHELVHGYQYQPKGIGSYGKDKEFTACIEGIADAVRAEAGFFDMKTRKPGGNWLDGYRTTGFFIQWLTTKDPDAIRNFHQTVKDLDVWSFDGAIKSMFGFETGIEDMWNEYQEFLKAGN